MNTSHHHQFAIRHLSLALASALACMPMLTGCLSPDTSGLSAEKGILQFENGFFSSRIRVVEDRTVKLEGDFLKAQVTVQNAGKRDMNCQYRFVWKDKHGMTLTSAKTLWLPLNLHGREQSVLEAICPVPGAADFRLVLRPL